MKSSNLINYLFIYSTNMCQIHAKITNNGTNMKAESTFYFNNG
jgi:hypothetical protein